MFIMIKSTKGNNNSFKSSSVTLRRPSWVKPSNSVRFASLASLKRADRTELCRLALSREFASQDFTAKAMRYPQCLPALMLPPEHLSRVICAKVAIS